MQNEFHYGSKNILHSKKEYKIGTSSINSISESCVVFSLHYAREIHLTIPQTSFRLERKVVWFSLVFIRSASNVMLSLLASVGQLVCSPHQLDFASVILQNVGHNVVPCVTPWEWINSCGDRLDGRISFLFFHFRSQYWTDRSVEEAFIWF